LLMSPNKPLKTIVAAPNNTTHITVITGLLSVGGLALVFMVASDI
jgi:hypothetical protein